MSKNKMLSGIRKAGECLDLNDISIAIDQVKELIRKFQHHNVMPVKSLYRRLLSLEKRRDILNTQETVTTEMSIEKQIFDLVESAGEQEGDTLHILDMSDEHPVAAGEGKYRVYHRLGYCIDVEKEYVCDPAEVNDFDGTEEDGFSYSVYTQWDGFEKINNNTHALKLIKSWLK